MRKPREDLTGQTFGAWKVLSYHSTNSYGNSVWTCQCSGCGKSSQVKGSDIKTARSQSCKSCSSVKHGHRGGRTRRSTRTYNSWFGMTQRCNYLKHVSYDNYGGRGITVCERWLIFENFLADMGERSPGTSIDRIDPNGNYEPGNCRWADAKTQARNKRHYAGKAA